MVDQSRVIRTVAGLRPYRRSGFVVRAEPLGDKKLVHNYGHGGGGITLSWGSSKLASELGLQGHSGPVAVLVRTFWSPLTNGVPATTVQLLD